VKSNYINQLAALFLLIAFAFTSCEEQSSIGIEVLPGGDLISVRNTFEGTKSFTFSEDTISTNRPNKNLLGSFTDSIFGNTTIGFAAQYRLNEFPDFSHNAQLDSIKLYLYYRIIYGDTLTKQKLKVYELESPLEFDKKYTQDVDLKSMAYDKQIGELEFTARVRLDSLGDTAYYQSLIIPLDISLGEKLFNADSLDMVNSDVFLEYFKGLYVETEKVSGPGGAILSLEALREGTFAGSALAMFYHNDFLKSEVDTTKDSVLVVPYTISPYSARVNSIVHDYSQTPFYDNLNKETEEDSLIYVQATGGLKSRILIDNLSSWRDSMTIVGLDTFRYAIHKAELVFQIDTVVSQVHKYQPPLQMLFTAVDSSGIERLPQDYVFHPSFYGGGLRRDYTYHFTITQHLQQIIDGKAVNNGFYLTPARKNDQANRVVLKGSTSKTGIQLIITYSKYTNF
jgi:hypothetical protein